MAGPVLLLRAQKEVTDFIKTQRAQVVQLVGCGFFEGNPAQEQGDGFLLTEHSDSLNH